MNIVPQNLPQLLTDPTIYAIMFCLLGGIFGFIGFLLGLKAVIDVKALNASTHSVQYMPIDPQVDKENQDWATSQGSFDEQSKLFQEDMEDEMPDLVPEKEDKKKYSF